MFFNLHLLLDKENKRKVETLLSTLVYYKFSCYNKTCFHTSVRSIHYPGTKSFPFRNNIIIGISWKITYEKLRKWNCKLITQIQLPTEQSKFTFTPSY